MKFFNWMQSKFNGGGGQGIRKSNSASAATYIQTKQEPPKEEFSDWPHGLLAIGTFGNCDHQKENPGSHRNINQDSPSNSSSEDDLSDFTPEEVGQLQKELTRILRRKTASKVEGEIAELPLDRFLNCPSSLEVDRRISTTACSAEADDREEDIDRTIRVIIDRCKDVRMKKSKKEIGKKSVSFLLKKMFVCRSGFAPAPSLRDTLQESRMEKLLRTMLSKKLSPQNASRAPSMKKYLKDRQTPKTNEEDETQEKANDGSKWVKTDSEWATLELSGNIPNKGGASVGSEEAHAHPQSKKYKSRQWLCNSERRPGSAAVGWVALARGFESSSEEKIGALPIGLGRTYQPTKFKAYRIRHCGIDEALGEEKELHQVVVEARGQKGVVWLPIQSPPPLLRSETDFTDDSMKIHTTIFSSIITFSVSVAASRLLQ